MPVEPNVGELFVPNPIFCCAVDKSNTLSKSFSAYASLSNVAIVPNPKLVLAVAAFTAPVPPAVIGTDVRPPQPVAPSL